MKKILATVLILSLAAGCALAAKPKPKPKPKPSASTHQETLGTEPLKGGQGEIGHTYTLGKSNPWNVRLTSAEYTCDTLQFGEKIIYPNASQKLLVLHYTVQNPQKSEAMMRFDTLPITAVTAKDENIEYDGNIAADDADHSRCEMEMKPGQKKDVFTVITVPAAGEIPKIMFKGSDDLVIRYDVRGKVKPLVAPFADPADPKGFTALATVPAQLGTYYPLGPCELKIDGISYATGAIGDSTPPEGGRFMLIACTAKNLDKGDVTFRFDTFAFKVADADGVPIDASQNMIRASSDAALDMSLKQGQEMKFRTYIPVEKSITPKTVTVNEGDGNRAYQYQVQ